jgi:hypothetical protein
MMSDTLYISRDEFREGVFKRDSYKCVVKQPKTFLITSL